MLNMYFLWCTILIYIISIPKTSCAVLHNKCVYIDYRGKTLNISEIGCPKSNICKRTFNISTIQIPPYSGFPLKTTLMKCCGVCTQFRLVNDFPDITKVTLSSIENSDFILPFLGSASATRLHGYYYIPIISAPNAFYVTTKDKPVLVRLVTDCLQLFPLIIICLLMAVISGFLAWIMETWFNREQFPREFLIGWFEGFWWSFISMTTVGYGDKTPKSVPARIFCIFWILIGVATFGLLTALLTGELMKANSPPTPEMAGANVGVMKYRDYDMYMIAKKGGIVTETVGQNFLLDLFSLINKLRAKEINGFLLDKYSLAFATYSLTYMLKKKEYGMHKADIEFFLKSTLRTEKKNEGEHFSYGILVKDREVYEYFRNAVQDNRIHFETKLALMLNLRDTGEVEINIFSPSDPYFLLSIKVISAIIGGICLFGFIYEMRRHKVNIYAAIDVVKCPAYWNRRRNEDMNLVTHSLCEV